MRLLWLLALHVRWYWLYLRLLGSRNGIRLRKSGIQLILYFALLRIFNTAMSVGPVPPILYFTDQVWARAVLGLSVRALGSASPLTRHFNLSCLEPLPIQVPISVRGLKAAFHAHIHSLGTTFEKQAYYEPHSIHWRPLEFP